MIDHPVFGTRCEVCFTVLTVEDCVVDMDGQKWDICVGDCAAQAGIIEQHEHPCPSRGCGDYLRAQGYDVPLDMDCCVCFFQPKLHRAVQHK